MGLLKNRVLGLARGRLGWRAAEARLLGLLLCRSAGWREAGAECREQGKPDGVREALEVDDGGDQEGLDLHVGQASPDGAGEAVPGLGLAMDAFDTAAVAAVERPLARSPVRVLAARPQQGRVVLVQQDGPAPHGGAEADRAQPAGLAVRDAGAVVLEAVAVRLAVRAEDLAGRAADDPVPGVQLETPDRDGAPLGRPLHLGRDHRLDPARLEGREDARDGVARVHRGDADGCPGRLLHSVKLRLHSLGVVLRASRHRDIEHHAGLGIDRGVLLVGGLHPPRAVVGRQAGVRVGAADRPGLRPVRRLDGVGVSACDRLPAHVGTHQRAVDVHHLAPGDADRDAGLDGAREDAPETLRAPALADAGQAGVVGQRLGQPVAGEPADGDVHRRLPHQPAVVHDAEQQPRQHQPHRRLGINPRPATAGRVAIGHLGPQPAEVENTVDTNKQVIVRDQFAKRTGEHQLMLTARPTSQHPATPNRRNTSESRQRDFFNRPLGKCWPAASEAGRAAGWRPPRLRRSQGRRLRAKCVNTSQSRFQGAGNSTALRPVSRYTASPTYSRMAHSAWFSRLGKGQDHHSFGSRPVV